MTDEKPTKEERLERITDGILTQKLGYLEAVEDIHAKIEAGVTLEEITAFLVKRQEGKERLRERITERREVRMAK